MVVKRSGSGGSMNCSGFTIIEVVVTLIVIGIVSAIVISRANTINADKIADIELVKSHLRYAQSRAMADSAKRWGIKFVGSTYSLYRNDNDDNTFSANEKVALPGADSDVVTLQSNLSCNDTIAFDWWGAPYTDPNCGTPMSGSLSFISESITVTPVTGFIP